MLPAPTAIEVEHTLLNQYNAWETVENSHAKQELYQLLSSGADGATVDVTHPMWLLFPGTRVRLVALPNTYTFLRGSEAATPTYGEVLDRTVQASGSVCVLVSTEKSIVFIGDHAAKGTVFTSVWASLSLIELVSLAAPSSSNVCVGLDSNSAISQFK